MRHRSRSRAFGRLLSSLVAGERPYLVSGSVDGPYLYATFSRAVNIPSSSHGFTVYINDTPQTPTYLDGTGTTLITFQLTPPATSGQTVQMAFQPPQAPPSSMPQGSNPQLVIEAILQAQGLLGNTTPSTGIGIRDVKSGITSTINLPTNSSGDILLLICNQYVAGTASAPVGWSTLFQTSRAAVYEKTSGGSESAPAWPNSNTDSPLVWLCYAVKNTSGREDFGAEGFALDTVAIAAPSVTSAGSDRRLITIGLGTDEAGANNNLTDLSTPTGNNPNGTKLSHDGTNGVLISSSYRDVQTGATGAKSMIGDNPLASDISMAAFNVLYAP